MEVLYQLSYVGAAQDPTVITTDPGVIRACNDPQVRPVPGGVFWRFLGV
jgi:hypothetical protein